MLKQDVTTVDILEGVKVVGGAWGGFCGSGESADGCGGSDRLSEGLFSTEEGVFIAALCDDGGLSTEAIGGEDAA